MSVALPRLDHVVLGRFDHQAGNVTSNRKLRVSIDEPPSTLNPAQANLEVEFRIARNTFDTLIAYNGSYQLTPSLCTGYSSNKSATDWTFRLRSGVKFHDGTPLDSTAVRKNFEYFVKNAGGLQSLLLPKIVSMDDSDPHVFGIRFVTPAAYMPENATIIYMVPGGPGSGLNRRSEKPHRVGPIPGFFPLIKA